MQPSPPPDPAYADQYPAQPVAPPQYAAPQPWQPPANQYAPVGYPYQPPATAPSMVTTFIAGVLAILLGLYQGFQAVVYVIMASIITSAGFQSDLGDIDELGWLHTFVIATGIASAVSAIVLLVGAVLLLVRKLFARWLIALGCFITVVVTAVPVILAQLFLTALSSQIDEDFSLFSGTGGWLAAFMVLLSVAVPVVTTVLAFLPSTRRYCANPGSITTRS